MAIYAVCLGMTLAVAAENEKEAVKKARSELQCKLEEEEGSRGKDALSFDMYQVSRMIVKDESIICAES